MATKKLINKSRPIGGKRRPKETAPASQSQSPPLAPALDAPFQGSQLGAIAPSTGNNGSNGSNRSAVNAQFYTGLSQIPHGLTFPTFDPNQYFATDLFSNSSSLQETEKEDADKAVESIEKKRQTLRIVGANIALNTDVVRTANDYRKFEGTVIDYDTSRINNETKFVNWQTAGTNRDIAVGRFDQAQERLIQGQKTLNGMRSITPLIDSEWQQRKSLKESQINSLKILAVQAKQALEPAMTQLSQDFRQELDNLN